MGKLYIFPGRCNHQTQTSLCCWAVLENRVWIIFVELSNQILKIWGVWKLVVGAVAILSYRITQVWTFLA